MRGKGEDGEKRGGRGGIGRRGRLKEGGRI